VGPRGIAWIPIVGQPLLASKIAKMHWWPILFIAGFWIPVVGGFLGLVFSVFFIIWMWRTFEVLGRPGWWAISAIFLPLYLIFLGVAAWGKSKKVQ